MLNGIRKTIFLLCLGVSILMVCIQYGTTDARYMRDNLEYFSQRMEEVGLEKIIQTHGIHMFAYPKAIAAYELCCLEQQWVYGYLTAKTSLDEYSGGKYDLAGYCPNDALSRLVVETNNKCMKNIYDLFLLDEAETAKEDISEEELDQFLDIREEFEETAYQACRALHAEMAVYTTIAVFLLTAGISGIIVTAVRKER